MASVTVEVGDLAAASRTMSRSVADPLFNRIGDDLEPLSSLGGMAGDDPPAQHWAGGCDRAATAAITAAARQPDGTIRMEFFSPANNAGYGKLYVMVIGRDGGTLARSRHARARRPDRTHVDRGWAMSGGDPTVIRQVVDGDAALLSTLEGWPVDRIATASRSETWFLTAEAVRWVLGDLQRGTLDKPTAQKWGAMMRSGGYPEHLAALE